MSPSLEKRDRLDGGSYHLLLDRHEYLSPHQARRSITLHFLLGLREKGKRNNNICLLRVKANGALNARLLRRKGRWDYIRDLSPTGSE